MSSGSAHPRPQRRLGAVTGLRSESRALRRVAGDNLVVHTGHGPRGAREAARWLVSHGADTLISIGLAGGLSPDVRAGDLVLADAIVVADRVPFSTDDDGRMRLLAASRDHGIRLKVGPLFGSDRAVATVEAKLLLHYATDALAVDMESHAVAAVAAEDGLPFLALRAVADPPGRTIPAPALAGLSPDGGTRPFMVAGRLALAPWFLPSVLRLAKDSRTGLSALNRAIPLLFAGFC